MRCSFASESVVCLPPGMCWEDHQVPPLGFDHEWQNFSIPAPFYSPISSLSLEVGVGDPKYEEVIASKP